jgi:hypothetical protein
MPRLRIGVLVDRQLLTVWQAQALRTLIEDADLLVYSCRNSRPLSRRLSHALYYLLNLFTIRNPLTRRVPWPTDLPAIAVHEFDALSDDNWQILPGKLVQQMREDRVDVIVKFGMGLLRIPPAGELSAPILSYHHGDPARFRGRPAGFYELMAGEPVIGQVVQRLSSRLDAGEIVASAETKSAAHSYRSTLIEAYRHSPLILRRAIANCLDGRSWTPPQWGRNHRLPSNGLVLKFLMRQWRRAIARLLYGLFKEKRWNLATAAIGTPASLESIVQGLSQSTNWQVARTPKDYRFLADPFFHPDRGLLAEGFNARSYRGEILHLVDGMVRRLSGWGGHYSYPATCFDGEQWHVVPEMSEWSSAKAFALHDNPLGDPVELRIPGRPALLDPTPFSKDGLIYLFANRAAEGQSVLRLWTAANLAAEFTEHPASPLRLSPHGSRMAGCLFQCGDGLIRVGQDLRREYGDGLAFFRVAQIGQDHYREEHVRDFRFEHCRGPHTLNLKDDVAAFDFYDERFMLFAGIRRYRERRAARRPG